MKSIAAVNNLNFYTVLYHICEGYLSKKIMVKRQNILKIIKFYNSFEFKRISFDKNAYLFGLHFVMLRDQ